MRVVASVILSLCIAAIAIASPPEVPSELKVKPGQVIAITVKTDKKIGVAKNFKATDGFFGELVAPAGQRQFMFQAPLPDADGSYKGKSQYVISWWTEGELEGATTTISIEAAVAPDPTPIDPEKPRPPKPPVKVTSFHVVMIYESGTTLTASQTGVLYSTDISAYLDTATNPDGGTKGWRRRDKDRDADTDTAFQKSLWAAIKPKLPNPFVTCWAIEVNGNVDIVALPASVADGLSILKKYKEGK